MTPPDATRAAYPYPTQSTDMLNTWRGPTKLMSTVTSLHTQHLNPCRATGPAPRRLYPTLTLGKIPKEVLECATTHTLLHRTNWAIKTVGNIVAPDSFLSPQRSSVMNQPSLQCVCREEWCQSASLDKTNCVISSEMP